MKRDTLFRLILAVSVAVAVFVVGYFMRPDLFGREETSRFGIIGVRGGGEPVPQLGGQVVYVEGGVEYRNGSGLWTHADEETVLTEGDAVETLSDGRAIIMLDDGSILRLDSRTQVVFDSLEPHSMTVTLVGGEVYSRVMPAERTFEIVADDTVYESLGTAYTTVFEEYESGVKVFHSKVRVKDADGNELAVVDEGNKYFIKSGDDPGSAGKITEMADYEVKDDEFVRWNASEDTKHFEEDMGMLALANGHSYPRGEIGTVESINLSYDRNGKVTWHADGDSPLGFKVLWSKTSGPTYPLRDGDQYKYYDDPDAYAGTIYAFDGVGTYHIRVCEYLGDVCGIYSNEVTAKFIGDAAEESGSDDEGPSSSVTAIQLSGLGPYVNWTVDGRSAGGYKLVWSKDSGPTYPLRSGDRYEYYQSADARSGEAYAFDGAGTYYARVCEYRDGRCRTYSNEVTLQLETEETGFGSAKVVPDGKVSSIALSAVGDGAVSWAADGYSDMGFKVLWSKTSGPTYPLRDGDKYIYMAEPDDSYVELFAFDGSGTYHVRVCEYLGGVCGVYSNEVEVGL